MSKQLVLALWDDVLHCFFLSKKKSQWIPLHALSHTISARDPESVFQECIHCIKKWMHDNPWKDSRTHVALPWNTILMQQFVMPFSFRHSDIVRDIRNHLSHWKIDNKEWIIDYQAKRFKDRMISHVRAAIVSLKDVQFWKDVLFSASLRCAVMDVDVCAVSRLCPDQGAHVLFLKKRHEWVMVMVVDGFVVRVVSHSSDDSLLDGMNQQFQWLRVWSGKCVQTAVFFSEEHHFSKWIESHGVVMHPYSWPDAWKSFLHHDVAPIFFGLSHVV